MTRVRIADVGSFLGVTQQRAHQMYREGKVPKPSRTDGIGPSWSPTVIERWAERHCGEHECGASATRAEVRSESQSLFADMASRGTVSASTVR